MAAHARSRQPQLDDLCHTHGNGQCREHLNRLIGGDDLHKHATAWAMLKFAIIYALGISGFFGRIALSTGERVLPTDVGGDCSCCGAVAAYRRISDRRRHRTLLAGRACAAIKTSGHAYGYQLNPVTGRWRHARWRAIG